jgi:hypothetical protein
VAAMQKQAAASVQQQTVTGLVQGLGAAAAAARRNPQVASLSGQIAADDQQQGLAASMPAL